MLVPMPCCQCHARKAQLIAWMIDYDNAQHHYSECIFRMADSEEISAPQPFQHLHHSPEWVWQNQKAATASTILGHETTGDHIQALKNKFEKPKRIVPMDDIMDEERLPQPKIVKSKGRSQALTEEDYLQLRQWWYDEFADIVNGTRNQLPPWREVNHEIHLIDDKKQYKYFTLWCPNLLHEELHAKVNQYVNSGWWEPRSVKQASPLLCISKKDGKLQTVVDAQQWNDNTVKEGHYPFAGPRGHPRRCGKSENSLQNRPHRRIWTSSHTAGRCC